MSTENVTPAQHLRGTVRVPGDKSISHRAVILGALSDGRSVVSGASSGDDVRATQRIVSQLGAEVRVDDGELYVTGPTTGLRESNEPWDCGNSGTTMRLLCGVAATIPGEHHLVGDESLHRRPMDRVAAPLALMGVRLEGEGERCTPPIQVYGNTSITAVHYDVPNASAQVKSAVLLAALNADGVTTVRERVRTRSATEDMLRVAGVDITCVNEGLGRRIQLTPSRPQRHHWRIPGDPSQAAFFAVLGAIHHDATLEVLSLDTSPERTGFISVLHRMGARVDLVDRGPMTGLRSESSSLHATEIHAHEIPSVDEVPILAVAAAAADGVSVFREVGELRVKESDRFAGVIELVRLLGAQASSDGDDIYVEGLGSSSRFANFTYRATLDHRMVMSAAVAGCAGSGATIHGAETVSSSYPNFFRDLTLLQ